MAETEPKPSGHAAVVVVFDLGGVITTRDTLAYVCRGFFLSRPWSLATASGLLVRRIAAKTPSARQHADRALVERALAGLTREQYDAAAREVVDRFVTAEWIRRDLVDELRAAAQSGPTVVATASESRLARSLLAALAVPEVLVLGSELERGPHGLRLRVHNVGEQKLASLRAAAVPLAGARFFTDSLTDLPVAAVCLRTVYVGDDDRDFDRLPRAARWCRAG